jgi:hypothetical protein
MSAPAKPGILAIWNDCKPGAEAEYEAWYRGEHLRERVGVPGFTFGRRYVALADSAPRYFTYYETASPDVLQSQAYLARGANPTPMTRHIMATVFQNMNRTICVQHDVHGEMRGGVVVTARADGGSAEHLFALWPKAIGDGGLLRAELWRPVEAGVQPPSVEEQIRGKDRKIGGCLLLEFASVNDGVSACQRLRHDAPATVTCDIYQFMSSLDQRDLSR